ncbi:molybdate ABC transporter permease subunit [Pseudenhygromyxa sp. WMMC2535]|uniref:ABC transporter permease n=1 Tax=Pseudenhygromyxa sp. WMMC2535 TaxID=2712867 RepID=UPI001552657C|nr:ABC transporter permease [Pseudenhygromyxa sp. WMMC2535]NVB42614.1 molybdate ABC transporter permease subunit [Pseudenhygromyxa sp. WMMC2535]
MSPLRIPGPMRLVGASLAGLLLVCLVLPLVALGWSSSIDALAAGLAHPLFAPALWLSLQTTLVSLALTLLMGTPLAWWLASSRSRLSQVVAVLVDLPIVIPPAVVGVGLLASFGRQGLLGPALASLGLSLPFSRAAVILAQLVVASPFYVQAAANAFRKVEPDTLIVARSLGASPAEALWRVALPVVAPGLVAGASLAWARAVGEFGATLLFAGNMQGKTQTMPLAIFRALETDVALAVVFSLVLAAMGAVLLAAMRAGPRLRALARGQGR